MRIFVPNEPRSIWLRQLRQDPLSDERRVKTIQTMKSPSMETLCELYADLVWLRNEVKMLERAIIHAPRDGWNRQRKEPLTKCVRDELH
jgi:hypothetical protein